mgnify:CR=1 FL=1
MGKGAAVGDRDAVGDASVAKACGLLAATAVKGAGGLGDAATVGVKVGAAVGDGAPPASDVAAAVGVPGGSAAVAVPVAGTLLAPVSVGGLGCAAAGGEAEGATRARGVSQDAKPRP